MAYRNPSEKALSWSRWLSQNQEKLFACGLPQIVLTNKNHWQDFLMHGYLDHHSDVSNFVLDNLSSKEKINLLGFLEVELTDEEKQSFIVYKLLKNWDF